jgi:hypothetical protein
VSSLYFFTMSPVSRSWLERRDSYTNLGNPSQANVLPCPVVVLSAPTRPYYLLNTGSSVSKSTLELRNRVLEERDQKREGTGAMDLSTGSYFSLVLQEEGWRMRRYSSGGGGV